MSVFKKNGKWFVRYRDIDGKQREKKAGLTKAIALELERKLLTDRDNQKKFGYKKQEDITFEEFVPIYLKRLKLRVKPSTIDSRKYVLQKMSAFFGYKLLSVLTEKDFFDYYNSTKATLKTIKNYFVILNAVLNEAKKLNYKTANIKPNIYYKPTKRIRYLTKEEAEKLIQNSKDLKLLILIALTTGMRKGEILSLEWENIDLTARLIHIEESKNGERRSVPINTVLYNELMLIENKKGKVVNVVNFRRKFIKIKKICGISDFHFHDLRHTFASWLAMDGVSLYTIKELLGHKSILMTQRYAHLSKDSRFNAVELIKI